MTGAILEFQAVHYRYPDGSKGLDDCTLMIAEGERTAILGANGAGKTTLLLHTNGLLRPQQGEVRYDDRLLSYRRAELIRLRTDIGMVFQNPDSQLFSASVREDVAFGPLNLGLSADEVGHRVDRALAAVHLNDCAHKPVQHLSFGQKKRVCLAGVLAMHPRVLILDEPMAGLDPAMQREFLSLLDELHASGLSVLLATHDLDFAYQWSDTMVIMDAGKCVARIATDTLSAQQEVLTRFGLGIPQVMQVWNALGSAEDTPPRSVEDLCRYIVDNGYK
ncbi:energy-coupling factor ABC transporter ATP-binding protein [Pelovirga terrestris]|uniref:ABC transporter ATP-binding protein n=1 Tax=Pelovirga terrestris TaxID=2771352 RepID=A0A8J6QU14_9BACT|nr:ABC transporter ATP-binding protein [Pelovirga terrestris]MBD1399830.1 ABC transporter ATP-binding protein [Pelovirga terrestris]